MNNNVVTKSPVRSASSHWADRARMVSACVSGGSAYMLPRSMWQKHDLDMPLILMHAIHVQEAFRVASVSVALSVHLMDRFLHHGILSVMVITRRFDIALHGSGTLDGLWHGPNRLVVITPFFDCDRSVDGYKSVDRMRESDARMGAPIQIFGI